MTDETKKKSAPDETVAEDVVATDEVVAEAAEETTTEVEEVTAAVEDETVETEDLVAEADTAEDDEVTEAVVPAAAKSPRPKARNAHIRTEVKDAPGKYAVIETGGKQYRVNVGDRLTVEKLEVESGGDVTFDRVLLLGGDGSTRIGTPVVEGAAVTATVNDHGRGEKIVVFKFKAKKRYRRRTGHRQAQTYITVTGISG